MSIQTIKHRGLRELYGAGRSRRISRNLHGKLIELMDHIDYGSELRDFHGVAHFHGLTGDRAGTYAFHVTRNWRLTFEFKNGDAYDLNYEDYH